MAGVEACQNLLKERYAMKDDIMITPLHQPGSILDPLTGIAREGARQMLAAALRAEATGFVARFADDRLSDGRQRVVRHGTGPERTIQTGIGPIAVQRQKVRDRATDIPAENKIRFTSNILPRWARRSRSLDALLPVLYLRGISTGDFQEALVALLGTDAPNLSAGVISRLTAQAEEVLKRKPASGAVFLLSRSPRRPAEALVPGWSGVLPLLQGAAEGAFPVAVFGGRNGSAVDDRPVVDVVGRHRLASSSLDLTSCAGGLIFALNQ